MPGFNYDSLYSRAAVRGKVREALVMPQTFARWGKEHMTQVAGMATWPARQWLGAFLQDVTGIPWLVYATSVDLAAMPRHDPLLRMIAHERTTDDPLLPLPVWLIDLTQDDVPGTAMLRFIDGVTHDAHTTDKPAFLSIVN